MTQPLNKPNFYIFTGGPGAGKTTVLNELAKHNYGCIPEVARAIIKEQHATGGNALHPHFPKKIVPRFSPAVQYSSISKFHAVASSPR